MKIVTAFFLGLAVVSAIPQSDQLLTKDKVLIYQNVSHGAKSPLIANASANPSGAESRYNPDLVNNYHLFTRENPTVSQPIVLNNEVLLNSTNYNSTRRTIVLIHGWMDSVTSAFNTVLVPAFLDAEDVNVIVVDWSHGSGTVAYPIAVINTPISGESVAKFITWLNDVTGSTLDNYHIVGHNLGAHQAGIVGRNLAGQVAYITGLDPAFAGFITNENCFASTDGVYTEVIHTNAGLLGYLTPLAHADFYPNGGVDMPGCISQECDSNRSFHYFGESIRSGGFRGTRCLTFASAMAGQCFMSGPLNMGGIKPKTGQSGIFYLRLDPAFAGFITNENCFASTDGVYTEVIHTNAGLLGYLTPLAHADFYPNEGVDMPGCISQECDSNRSFHYFGESIRSGGFRGTRCLTFASAMAGQCFMSGPLNMGGIKPKTGQSGIFYLRTNAFPPFSRT